MFAVHRPRRPSLLPPEAPRWERQGRAWADRLRSVHPDLGEIAFLIGTWRGRGRGEYPTIDDFEYEEEARYAPGPDKPFLVYTQRSWNPTTGEPLHSELGYLRPAGAGRVELVIAQPTGIVEIHTGSIEATHVHFRAGRVEVTPTAKEVTDVERHLSVEGGELRYRLSMAAVGQPLTVHLEAALLPV